MKKKSLFFLTLKFTINIGQPDVCFMYSETPPYYKPYGKKNDYILSDACTRQDFVKKVVDREIPVNKLVYLICCLFLQTIEHPLLFVNSNSL